MREWNGARAAADVRRGCEEKRCGGRAGEKRAALPDKNRIAKKRENFKNILPESDKFRAGYFL